MCVCVCLHEKVCAHGVYTRGGEIFSPSLVTSRIAPLSHICQSLKFILVRAAAPALPLFFFRSVSQSLQLKLRQILIFEIDDQSAEEYSILVALWSF